MHLAQDRKKLNYYSGLEFLLIVMFYNSDIQKMFYAGNN